MQNDAAAAHVVVRWVEPVESVSYAVTTRITLRYEGVAERREVAAVDVRESGVCRALVRSVAAAAVAHGVSA